ncbi:two-component system chemotaxis response regulator CheB [Novispirillum itersonii]|uniref:Protein-glutamate methylesterase/protein-glutamine glutaminase n=2 Tax=Novispirillum itersonii TaxID=189 RepID=A0A7X0DQ77_NOVIT|nr:two-component system chemotaxis response regulator CheB [Novispirillum itersonii]
MSLNRDTGAGGAAEPFRVMVVDDSAVVRGLETRMLESDPSIKVVASVGNGQSALQTLDRMDIEVIVLDIEMPVMDGLEALPKILEKHPGVRVLMSSTLTQKNAEISIRAMELGATDYIPKPSSSRELTGASDFRTMLVDKVKALGLSARRGTGISPARRSFSAQQSVSGQSAGHTPFTRPAAASPAAAPAAGAPASPATAARTPFKAAASAPATAGHHSLLSPTQPISLRPAGNDRPDVVVIGSSTGGPQALFTVLGGLKKAGGIPQPILITQHMPATFTTILAEHISRIAGLTAREGQDGEKIEGGRVYIAPGDFHMTVEVRGGEKVIKLDKGPPENFCRPAVDPLFRSISAAYGRRVLACVLTGMGSDGAKGGRVIADAGGTLIAQDEASSVVWGMPGATANTGACSAILPISDVADYIYKTATRRA